MTRRTFGLGIVATVLLGATTNTEETPMAQKKPHPKPMPAPSPRPYEEPN